MLYTGKITLCSYLSHNSDMNFGVDTKFRRLSIIYRGRVENIPIYSGNAFRGIFRRLIMHDYLTRIGVEPRTVSPKLYHILFSGGRIEKGSKKTEVNLDFKREVLANCPPIAILGTALGNEMFEGKLSIGMGIPITRETSFMTDIQTTLSVWDIIDEIFYTRKDDFEMEKRKEYGTNQMRFTVECLKPGTELFHELHIDEIATELEKSCFEFGICLLQKNGTLGGKSGIGHGKVKLNYTPVLGTGDLYLSWIEENRAKVKDWFDIMNRKV